MVPEVDPGPDASFIWAHDFGFVGGQTGRLGLQSATKAAVFSVSSAVAAEGAGTERIAGGGWSCRLPYPWQPGRHYRLRVWTVEPGWWAASVRDDATAAESDIGFIQVPSDWRQLDTPSVMCTEYHGPPVASCADVPYCSAVFSSPSADAGSATPERMHSRLGGGTCDSSHVEPVPGGVRHQIGGP
ncbi:MAG: hypothetical protein M3O23_04810 [Actinomycetota bacterium]|nr:hypothetical protein [Actinomycetota bacterium]